MLVVRSQRQVKSLMLRCRIILTLQTALAPALLQQPQTEVLQLLLPPMAATLGWRTRSCSLGKKRRKMTTETIVAFGARTWLSMEWPESVALHTVKV